MIQPIHHNVPGLAAALLATYLVGQGSAVAEPGYRVATFSADVTCPIGHALLAGALTPAKKIVDPLLANGCVLLGAGEPIVMVAIDWCEIRNDAYDRWREALARAAGTTRERIMLTAVHQHDAPLADLEAQRLLDEQGLEKAIIDRRYFERCVQRVAKALGESLAKARRITHFGIGQAKVEKVASNRRVVGPDGKVSFPRNSATGDPKVRAAPVGTIDPWLKTLSFWNGDRPVVAMSCYSVHPMSYYGRGGVSWDFVGMARQRRQTDDPTVKQIYFTGCSGDTTAGKYNDGAAENRPVLADRIYRGMVAAWKATKRHPLKNVAFRVAPLRLKQRTSARYTRDDLTKRLTDKANTTSDRARAAMGLSWRKRVAAGQPIDVPALDLGAAQFMLMPGETFVGYQLTAQRLRPDSFVMVAGFAESAPGYIPTAQETQEGFIDRHHWCWVDPGNEPIMTAAMAEALKVPRDSERRDSERNVPSRDRSQR